MAEKHFCGQATYREKHLLIDLENNIGFIQRKKLKIQVLGCVERGEGYACYEKFNGMTIPHQSFDLWTTGMCYLALLPKVVIRWVLFILRENRKCRI